MMKVAVAKLEAHKLYDDVIDINDSNRPLWGWCYILSEKESEVLHDWLTDMLEISKIRGTKSPAGLPILFIPKAHGRGLRLCVDYRGLNKITIANHYPLAIMSGLQDCVSGIWIFTKLDLKNGYHLILVKKGYEWKTTIRYQYGLYEFMVMRFGLTNAPATYQDMINHILKQLLNKGVVVDIDDILIYSNMQEKYDLLVHKVLKGLAENALVISPEKLI
jgi:hypothetical protein